jgi:membrane-bound lytic murein transglycosylase F
MLERVQERGELLIATRSGPTTFYATGHGYAGIEYELASRFAAHLGVSARFVTPGSFRSLLGDVSLGRVHMGAAGLAVTRERRRQLRFAMPYQTVMPQLVYRRGNGKPRTPADLADGRLAVVAGSRHGRIVKALEKALGRPLNWRAVEGASVEQLVNEVDAGTIDFTIADSNELALLRRYLAYAYPAFEVGDPAMLAWAFPRWPDDSLARAADDFLRGLEITGELQALLAKYYAFEDNLNFVDKREFWRNVDERLPHYQAYFEAAATEIGIDWRMLAAIGYQESHWNPEAVSPTGVRGIMMLTQDTATQVGVEDRQDPRASIFGGARYLRVVEEKIPDRIPEPDRLWLTLAGYNIGFGHLEDARILTQRQGGDPDRWEDVRQRLPLLTQKKYYSTLKHGRARGHEPVTYVDNIRSYYELLRWHTENRPTQALGLLAEADDG